MLNLANLSVVKADFHNLSKIETIFCKIVLIQSKCTSFIKDDL